MIISIEWLKEFVDVNEPVAELADLLTNAGLEAVVTGVPSEIPGVVIGFYTSRLLGKWVTRIGLRRAVLILSITSAAGVLLRGLITE